MKASENGNRSAFGSTESVYQGVGVYEYYHHAGLTKRELFAAMAMQGMTIKVNSINDANLVESTAKHTARAALALADTLLKELSKGSEG